VKTPVDNFATRLVSQLSGGERKRLVLDLLLTSGADVLFLDEPDNYLDIIVRGRPAADGPRYKALGNSMAVPVMAWIGKRIQEVECL
jgi:ABC-type sugar transport system ATPase subunit